MSSNGEAMTETIDATERAAQAAHEVNRAFCIAIGDTSQVPWEEAPEGHKASSRNAVQVIIDDPSVTPEQLHAEWSADKVNDGWKFGPVKDTEAKEHPCLVPYAELPEFQRAKDALLGAAIRGVLAHYASAS